LYEIIFGWQNPGHIFNPEFGDVHVTLKFNGDSSTGRWSTKIWKKIAKLHSRKWWFHGQNADFQATKKFLQEIFFKYKLHIISVLCRAQSIPIHFSDFCRALFLFDTLSCFSSVGWRLENLVNLEGWVILLVKSH